MANIANYNWDTLEAYTKTAADTILAGFEQADLGQYKHFLNSMYHYTLNSGERLEFAAKVADNAELKAFYQELADDEESHYRLAQADLEEFGETVDPHTVPDPVQRFHDYWQSLGDQPIAYLGVLYVAENIAKYAGHVSVIDMFPNMQLTRAQTRWLRVHAEVDLEHGAEVQEMCAHYMDGHEKEITDAAAMMSYFWCEMLKEGLYGKAAPRSA